MQPKRHILALCLLFLFSLTGCAVSGATSPPETESNATVCNEPTAKEPTTTETHFAQTEQTLPSVTMPETTVDPSTLWTPICEEFIYLRSTPGGEPITKISVGENVVLKDWCGKYALVTYDGQQGYVQSNYIKPAEPDYLANSLQVVTPTNKYSYEQMLADISDLQRLYPDAVRTASIGMSELGRKIPVMQIGAPDAKFHVLMQGAIHGREHFTAWLLMALADYSLSQGYFENGAVCYHIIPMSNPDGVVISQTGMLNSLQTGIYENDFAAGYTSSNAANYATQWKANALGIDLNRNFSAGWEASLERPEPSSEKHRGATAFSAAESCALRDYTLQYDFDATVSVHSHGSVIYYQYGNRQPVNTLSYSLACAAREVTGYDIITYDGTSGAGYKDWAMDVLGIPSLTLEIGCYETPLATRDIYNTFVRCQELLPAIDKWLQENT